VWSSTVKVFCLWLCYMVFLVDHELYLGCMASGVLRPTSLSLGAVPVLAVDVGATG
jgi:TM2 domain-containing membrane protein YozV